MNFDNLRDVFHGQLQDMYSAEKQMTEALPKIHEAASSPNLKKALANHLETTLTQLETVRNILDRLDLNPAGKKCKAMEGLVAEANDLANHKGDKDARDAGIICACQKIEHYEIATYGSLRTWARLLGEEEIADALDEILDQEYDADNELDAIAEGYLNQKAKS